MSIQDAAYRADQYAKMFHTIAAETAATEVQVGAVIQQAENRENFFSSFTDPISHVLQSFTPAETVQIGLALIGLIIIWKKV
jgi:hypothetical protein